MKQTWKEISRDEILNSNTNKTGFIEQYGRIMRQYHIEAIDKAVAQSRTSQVWLTVLTFVIAVATVTYTWVTWESVQAQREANTIQEQLINQPPKANLPVTE